MGQRRHEPEKRQMHEKEEKRNGKGKENEEDDDDDDEAPEDNEVERRQWEIDEVRREMEERLRAEEVCLQVAALNEATRCCQKEEKAEEGPSVLPAAEDEEAGAEDVQG